MQDKISAYQLSKQVFSYPTKSELIKKLCDRFVIYTLTNLKKEIWYFLKSYLLQLITLFIWIILISGFVYYKTSTWSTIEDISIGLYNFISGNLIWWPFIYIWLYMLRPVVLFPATPLTFMSGALFGFWGGMLYTMIWATLSAGFAYFLGKIFGKKLIWSDDGSSLIGKMKEKANKW